MIKALLAGSVLVALFGLALFVAEILLSVAPETASGEGVVVLTGGRDRIDVGVDILEAHRARRLLISGVNPATTAEAIRRPLNAEPGLFQCCIDLGRQAATTRGNAVEAADWVTRHGFRSLVVVTSSYHLPRAVLELRGEFRRRQVDVALTTVAVRRADFEANLSNLEPQSLRTLLAEYVKFMLAHMRILAERLGMPQDALAAAIAPEAPR